MTNSDFASKKSLTSNVGSNFKARKIDTEVTNTVTAMTQMGFLADNKTNFSTIFVK